MEVRHTRCVPRLNATADTLQLIFLLCEAVSLPERQRVSQWHGTGVLQNSYGTVQQAMFTNHRRGNRGGPNLGHKKNSQNIPNM